MFCWKRKKKIYIYFCHDFKHWSEVSTAAGRSSLLHLLHRDVTDAQFVLSLFSVLLKCIQAACLNFSWFLFSWEYDNAKLNLSWHFSSEAELEARRENKRRFDFRVTCQTLSSEFRNHCQLHASHQILVFNFHESLLDIGTYVFLKNYDFPLRHFVAHHAVVYGSLRKQLVKKDSFLLSLKGFNLLAAFLASEVEK